MPFICFCSQIKSVMDIDTKYLRKFEFPQSARECLRMLEKYHKNISSRSFRELQTAINEHLLCVLDRRGCVQKRLTPFQDFQLLHEICLFFEQRTSEGSRYAIFELIFPTKESKEVYEESYTERLSILPRLVAYALHIQSSVLLNDAALWISKVSKPALVKPIINRLIEDFCIYEPLPIGEHGKTRDSENRLLPLMDASPSLACAFLCFALEYYGPVAASTPPFSLVEALTCWVIDYQVQLLKSYKELTKSSSNLPSAFGRTFGRLAQLACVLPFDSSSKNADDMCCRLQTGLLQLMLALSNKSAAATASADTLILLRSKDVVEVLIQLSKFKENEALSNSYAQENIDFVLDRLTQVLQVAVASNLFRGTGKDIEIAARPFQHELLHLVVNSIK